MADKVWPQSDTHYQGQHANVAAGVLWTPERAARAAASYTSAASIKP